jgi:WD40 repeat protein
MVAVLPHLGALVHVLTFSPNGKTLAAAVLTASDQTGLWFWNVTTHRALASPITEKTQVSAVAYSPSGRILAVATDVPRHGQIGPDTPGVIDLWDLRAHRLLHRLRGDTSGILSLEFSPTRQVLASGSLDGTTRLWDVSTGAQAGLLRDHGGPVLSVMFSPDGTLVASNSERGGVVLWNLTSNKAYNARGLGLNVPSMTFSHGGQFLYATGGNGKIIDRYDVPAAAGVSPPFSLPNVTSIVVLAASPDGKILVGGGQNGSLVMLDVGGQTFYQRHLASLSADAVSPDGRLVATGATDGTAQLWPAGDPASARQLPGPPSPVYALAFSRNGLLLAAAYQDCAVRVWKLGTNAPQPALSVPGRRTGTSAANVVFSSNGKALISYCSGGSARLLTTVNTVTVRDTATFRVLALFHVPTPTGLARGLAISPNGDTLAVSTGKGAVVLWSTRTHRIIGRIVTGRGTTGPVALAFSPGAQLLATADADDTVRLWHVPARTLAGTIGPETSEMHDLAFSPDGALLAGTGQDATVRLWKVATRQLALSLTAYPWITGNEGTATAVNRIAFGPPRAQLLIAALGNGTAQVWNLSPADEVHRICGALGRATVAGPWQRLSPSAGPDPCHA